jgi:hypothetical protein
VGGAVRHREASIDLCCGYSRRQRSGGEQEEGGAARSALLLCTKGCISRDAPEWTARELRQWLEGAYSLRNPSVLGFCSGARVLVWEETLLRGQAGGVVQELSRTM